MQRIIFSGRSNPSTSAHRRKKRHGSSSLRPKPSGLQRLLVVTWIRTRGPDIHTLNRTKMRFQKLGGSHTALRVSSLSRDNVHVVYERAVRCKTGLRTESSPAAQ